MTRKLYTKDEIVLCTYIARFGRNYLSENQIAELEGRPENSVKMKVQNIAAMLKEEGFTHSVEVSCLSGLTTGESGRRTNWDIVEKISDSSEQNLKAMCREILES